MTQRDPEPWTPFRPAPEALEAIAAEVAEIRTLQRTLVEHHPDLCVPDRVAHQYQIAGGRVRLRVGNDLPIELEGVGLFKPGTEYIGVGRISTGLGTPHVEPGLDFLGIMLAFESDDGHRVDFLGINHPAAPTDDHRAFVDVLHATGESADAEVPLFGDLGDRDLIDTAAEQTQFVHALAKRMGVVRALKTVRHLIGQTKRTFLSRTAHQAYWTGIVEAGGAAGKFTLVPSGEHAPEAAAGERRLTEDWNRRQQAGDVEFMLYWIPYRNADETPLDALTDPWEEAHKLWVGAVAFPRTDLDSDEARLWATLATEMGANPGNWVRDRENRLPEPATEFGTARKLAYRMSQEGRNALEPELYRSVFRTGEIDESLARELSQRRADKEQAGHVSDAGRP